MSAASKATDRRVLDRRAQETGGPMEIRLSPTQLSGIRCFTHIVLEAMIEARKL